MISKHRWAWIALLVGMAISTLAHSTLAADPSTAPFLRLNLGNHTAQINRLATDAAESVVVTASDDKTLGVWNAADGTLEGMMRAPIEPGLEGKFYAVVVSADGEFAYAAGHTGSSWDRPYRIYKFDLKTKAVVARASNIPTVVDDMRFSPDGAILAVAYGTGGGIDLFHATTLKRLSSDGAYKAMISAISFSQKGDLAVVSHDGTLRIYAKEALANPKLKPTHTVKLSRESPTSVAFNANGDKVAVGYSDERAPDLHGGPKFKREKSPSIAGIPNGTAGTVAWVTGVDGREELIAAGTLNMGPGRYVARRWHADGTHQDLVIASNSIKHILPTKDGGYFFASADPSWGRVSQNDQLNYHVERPIVDFRDAYQGRLATSPDGMRVAFQSMEDGAPFLKFDLIERTLTPDDKLTDTAEEGRNPDGVISVAPNPDHDAKAIRLVDWRNSIDPKLKSKEIKLGPGEYSRSIVALPDGKRFALGAEYSLSLFTTDGKLIKAVNLPAPAWALVAPNKADFIVAALGDGTIRWFNVGDQREPLEPVIAFFPHRDGKRWVVWTNEGFFDYAKGGGSEMVGFHFNEGAYKTRWMDFENAYRILYSSDLVTAKIDPKNDARIAQRLAMIGDLHKVTLDQPKVTLLEFCQVSRETRGVKRATPTALETSNDPAAASSGGDICGPLVTSRPTRGVKRATPTTVDEPASVNELETEADQIRVRFTVETREGVGGVQAFRNGRNASDQRLTRGVSRVKSGATDDAPAAPTSPAPAASQPAATPAPAPAPAPAAAEAPTETKSEIHEVLINLDDGPNLVEVRAFDHTGQVYGAAAPFKITRVIKRDLPTPIQPEPRRVLLMAVGINAYQGDVNPLSYAKSDTKSFADIMFKQMPNIFDKTASEKAFIQLYDEKATKKSIIEGLSSIKEMSRPGDLVVIYLAGHGVALPISDDNPQQAYYYLTHDVKHVDDETLRANSLSGSELITALSNLRAKDILLVFDTCHAGQFLKSGVEQLRKEIGNSNIWAASTSVQEAVDGYKNTGHGLFFHAISVGLTDPSEGVRPDAKGNVYLKDTGRFLTHKVRDLASEIGWQQRPFIRDSEDQEESELIPLAVR